MGKMPDKHTPEGTLCKLVSDSRTSNWGAKGGYLWRFTGPDTDDEDESEFGKFVSVCTQKATPRIIFYHRFEVLEAQENKEGA